MPYIKSNDGRRNSLQIGDVAKTAGELNYQIFYYVKHHRIAGDKEIRPNIFIIANRRFYFEKIKLMSDNFLILNGKNYQRYNDMVGCLILCAKEIKRRLGIDLKEMFNDIIDSYDNEITKYEDKKILENGDVE